MRRGLYRIHGTGGRPDDVRIDADGIETPLEERFYRARGYLPAVDDLPWQEDYFGAKSAADDLSSAAETARKAEREAIRKEFLTRFCR